MNILSWWNVFYSPIFPKISLISSISSFVIFPDIFLWLTWGGQSEKGGTAERKSVRSSAGSLNDRRDDFRGTSSASRKPPFISLQLFQTAATFCIFNQQRYLYSLISRLTAHCLRLLKSQSSLNFLRPCQRRSDLTSPMQLNKSHSPSSVRTKSS